MSYEFDEIKFSGDEGLDWWDTIKKVPIKIVDQDFGTEVSMQDLVDSTRDEKPEEKEGASSLSKDEQDVRDSKKKMDADCAKRKESFLANTGYSKVLFGKKSEKPGELDEHGKPKNDVDWFEAEISSNQFQSEELRVKIKNGFLLIYASSVRVEGAGLVCRRFVRRYMLPRDCHIFSVQQQLHITTSDVQSPGVINVKVDKKDPAEYLPPDKKTPRKPAGRSPSPLKSPSRYNELKIAGRSPPAHKTPPRGAERRSAGWSSPTKMFVRI